MRQPLAYRLAPEKLDDILGQEELVGKGGIIRSCLEKGEMFSCIFYGPPGCGKTTLARVIAKQLGRPYRRFNAVTGNKKDLDQIFAEAKLSDGLILICDEVHRLNKDKQDLLLPHVEDGSILLIGATTANPYHSINPAIRSRCHLFAFHPLTREDVKKGILHALECEEGLCGKYRIEEETLNLICDCANGDIRYALNLLEISAVLSRDFLINEEVVARNAKNVNNRSFGTDDGYYDLLSAFQKSIRGSDVNAALYYLCLLAQTGDLTSICRRLLVIAYEDIGLANPALIARTYSACEAAEYTGFPEAVIPLGVQVIDLSLSPKSRTAMDALHEAEKIVEQKAYEIPAYLKYTPAGLSDQEKYSYERYDCFHKIRYLPDELKDLDLFPSFNANRYEQQLKAVYEELKRIDRTSDLKKLYQ